jgi:hypothetical protein
LKNDEDREFETILIRQAAHHRFTAIVYTPVQWISKIVQKQDRQGKVSAADLAKLFKKPNVKAAKGQEEISATFITNACYIWDHALCYSEVHDVLIRGAERFSHNSMFDSISKITDIVRKCKMDGVKIKWVFGMLFDRVQEKYMSVGDCSNANLFGHSGKKGEMDVLLALLELKDHLLYEFVPMLGLEGSVVKALQTNFDSISAYRQKVPELESDGKRVASDLLWMAAWPIPVKRLSGFIEGILYKNQYQRLVRQNCANKQSPKEV